MPFTIRALTAEDVVPLRRVLAGANHTDFDPDLPERIEHVLEYDRTRGVFDGDDLVGVCALLTKEITLPGGVTAPVAAMTAASVLPGYQRQGALAQVTRSLVEDVETAKGEALAIMWASEGSLYGRYGCGELATDQVLLSIPHGAKFHDGVDIGTEPIRERGRAEALPFVKQLYDRMRRTHTGWLKRSEGAWNFHLDDAPGFRGGLTGLRFAIHPQGYALYRFRHGSDQRSSFQSEIHVKEVVAENDVARAALLRHMLDIGLGGELKYYAAPDDSIVHMLANPRLALRSGVDAVWLRIVHLDQALRQRRYLSDVDAVIEVADRVCAWNQGCWRLTVKDGEASVARSGDEPDVSIDITALASAFLGGVRLSTLAGAQKVREHTRGTVVRLSLAFLDDREPYCPEFF